jgi:urease accessory protein
LQAGSLELKFANLQGSSKMVHRFAQAPYKVQKPFYPEGEGVVHVVVLHTAGGIVGGDLLKANIELKQDSKVLLTTATAGKVYRSLAEVSQQKIICNLASGSCLEWLPQEMILFNGAIYHQQMQIELAEGAIFLGWDINRYGRTAAGQRYISGNYLSDIEITQAGSPLWIDRQNIIGDIEFIDSPNTLDGHSVTGTLVLLGIKLEGKIWEQLKEIKQIDQNWGFTALPKGLLCRYRGDSTQQAQYLFRQIWAILRPFYLGVNIPAVRVWQNLLF